MPKAGQPTAERPTSQFAWAALVVWWLYLLVFYAVPLTALPARDDGPWRRYQLFQYLLAPDVLWDEWTGGAGAVAIGDRLSILVPAGWTALVACSLGSLMLRFTHANRGLTRAEAMVFAAAVGGSFLSLLTLLVGMQGRLGDRSAMWAMEAALLAASAGGVWRDRRRGKERPKNNFRSMNSPHPTSPGGRGEKRGSYFSVVPKSRQDEGEDCEVEDDSSSDAAAASSPGDRWWFLAIAGACALFAAVTVLGAMLPPVEFDVREYHLQAPKEFFQNGRITFLPHNIYGNMPLGLEMFALHGMALTGEVRLGALVGKTLIAGMGLLAAVGVFLVARRWFGRSDAYWGLLVFATTPWVVRESTAGLIDAALGAYVILAIHAALIWRSATQQSERRIDRGERESDWPLLALAGFLAGSAAACKYPAAVFVTLPLGVWTVAVGRKRPLGTALIYAAAACVAGGIWLFKNYWLTGNPVYPLLYDWFGGISRTAELNSRWTQAHAPHGFGLVQLADSSARALISSDWLSPLAWPLLFVAWRLAVPRRLVRGMIGYVTLFMALWWLMTHRIDRFWLPMLPVLAVVAGTGAAALDEGRTRWPFRITAALCVTANLLYCVIAGPGAYNRFFVSLDTAWNDPLRIAPWHAWLNEHAPADAAVLTVGDAEVFDLTMRAVYDTAFDRCQFERLTSGRSPDEIRTALATEKISHVLVRWDEIARYRSPGNYGYSDYVTPERFDALVEHGILERPLVFHEGSVEVYPVSGP